MSCRIRFFALIISCFYQNEAARILAVVPSPSISHQVVFRPLTQELVKRGHEVVIITTDPAFPKGHAPKNLTEIDIHDISYEAAKQFAAGVSGSLERIMSSKETDLLYRKQVEIFEQVTQIPEVQDLIRNKNNTFDLILAEAYVRYLLGFSYAFRAPVIQVSSFGGMFDNYDVIGAPTHLLLYPQITNVRVYDLTLWEKVVELYHYYQVLWYYYQREEHDNQVLRRIFGADMPDLSELRNNVDMMFLNVHPIWDSNRPVPPGVIYMGGIHISVEKELPAELKDYLDASKNGVIYISFGSNVDPTRFSRDKVQAIIDAVSKLPYDVLWKWNNDELPGKTDNIRISKWLPQSDLLRHPNVKLFITQGGLQSADEAITAGVPLIGVPIWGDQFFNVEKYVHHKIGLQVKFEDLNAELLKSSILKIVGDESYRTNIVRLRNLMRDQPMSPLERAVWWTEHLLRHGGGRHLRAPAANMSWTQYYEIELVLTVLVVMISVIVFSLIGLYLVVRFVKGLLMGGVKVKKS